MGGGIEPYSAMNQIPRTPNDTVRGIVYLPRMFQKIRLHAQGVLHPDYHANLGKGFDDRACLFLQVAYADVVARVLQGGDDDEVAAWCFERGGAPDRERIEVWNGFMRKRGWRDEASELLAKRKRESGFEGREDIQTFFGYIDADEGR